MDLKTIGIYVGIWLVGYALGLFEAWVKNKNKKKKEDERLMVAPEVQQGIPAPALPLAMPETALSLFEKPAGGLKIQLDGDMLLNREDLQPEQRKRLIGLVVGLRPWLEDSKEKVAAPPARPASQQVEPQPVSVSPTAAPVPASVEVPTGEVDYAKLSMVQQIDRVLQRNLSGHPLQAKGIRVQESITGGVNFYIGLSRYEFIDEIPDPAIREVIQQAITDWENSTTHGL